MSAWDIVYVCGAALTVVLASVAYGIDLVRNARGDSDRLILGAALGLLIVPLVALLWIISLPIGVGVLAGHALTSRQRRRLAAQEAEKRLLDLVDREMSPGGGS